MYISMCLRNYIYICIFIFAMFLFVFVFIYIYLCVSMFFFSGKHGHLGLLKSILGIDAFHYHKLFLPKKQLLQTNWLVGGTRNKLHRQIHLAGYPTGVYTYIYIFIYLSI